jgi:hypothetical protein
MSDAQLETKGSVRNKAIKILAYAETVRVGQTARPVKEAYLAL